MPDPQRYPLDWPVGEPRTEEHAREWGRFKVTLAHARGDLLHELELLGARDVVISTNIPTRTDGLPYSSWSGRVTDPGVAVYWSADGRLHVMACDRYDRPESNLRAIGLTIAALRTVERHGTRQLRDRAFSGFRALPAEAGASSWRAALGLGDGPITREAIDAAWRRAAQVRHPDRGGSQAAMAELNRAREEALREVRGG